MRKIRDVLRLKLEARLSHERIAVSLGISKGVVAKYVGLAGGAGLEDAKLLGQMWHPQVQRRVPLATGVQMLARRLQHLQAACGRPFRGGPSIATSLRGLP
jgi:hypothetical protein